MEADGGSQSMRKSHAQRDEEGMTAVIEFLTAFVLFLMIVTAFLSLAQLTLGPYDSTTDRLDHSAVAGLTILTDSQGWFTPIVDEERDTDNSTTEWHLIPAEQLAEGDVLPGLANPDGALDIEKIQALSNVTESQLAEGIGLDSRINLRLIMTVIESNNPLRTGMVIFDDGTSREKSRDSASASRVFPMSDELVRVTLEVHDAVRTYSEIEISEFMPRPANGGPEWIELYNPNGFAVDMKGWGLERTTQGYGSASVLFEEGTLPGGERAILSGDLNSQDIGNASWSTDVSSSGLLGYGAIEGLGDLNGKLVLTRASTDTSLVSTVMDIEWDQTWNLSSGQSLLLIGEDPSSAESWSLAATPTPGD